MQTIKLYIKDWLAIHPYIQQQTTDRYLSIWLTDYTPLVR